MSIESVTPNTSSPVSALLERSNRLGSDPRNTNYAGGNTSAKGTGIDPASGLPVGDPDSVTVPCQRQSPQVMT